MSDNRANIAIIGDRDSVMLFKAIGLALQSGLPRLPGQDAR